MSITSKNHFPKIGLIAASILLLCYCDNEIRPVFTLRYQDREVIVEDTFRMVIIGNSITAHPPVAELDWHDNWGMAATAQENDFVHKLFGRIKVHKKIMGKASMKFENVALFESGFTEFDGQAIEKSFSHQRKFNPHLVIFRWGDNVNDSLARKHDFQKKFTDVIDYFKSNKIKEPMFIISGTWYPKTTVNEQFKNICTDYKIPFVSLDGLRWIAGMSAEGGKIINGGVASHPSDQGMKVIADSLYNTIEKMVY